MGLQSDVGAGLNDIKVIPIKKASSTISNILCNIINRMLPTGMFPGDLKFAIVNLVCKAGGKIHLIN